MWPAAGALSAPLKRRERVKLQLTHRASFCMREKGKTNTPSEAFNKDSPICARQISFQSRLYSSTNIWTGNPDGKGQRKADRRRIRAAAPPAQQSVPTRSRLETLFWICARDTGRIEQRCASSVDIWIKPFPQPGFITACKHINMICSSNSGFGLQRKDLITELTSDGKNHSHGLVPDGRLWAARTWGEEPSPHRVTLRRSWPNKTLEKSGWVPQGPALYKHATERHLGYFLTGRWVCCCENTFTRMYFNVQKETTSAYSCRPFLWSVSPV